MAENSGIKDKNKLMRYLYKNPKKLAIKLSKFLQDDNGEALAMVSLKGKGQGYYYSIQDKKFVRVCRSSQFYLLPWDDPKDNKRCYIYTHFNWMTGCILKVYKDEIIELGHN